MTKLIVVRHGQSESNLAQIFTGQGDTLLTELGKRQAQNTARFLREIPIDAIYSSDLSRAVETARPTAEAHGLPVHAEPLLREIHAGEWEGHTYAYLQEHDPQGYDLWRTDIGRAQPAGGESVVELASRVYRCVDALIERHRGGCIAVFTHATPLRVLGARWHGYAPEESGRLPFGGNASVSMVEISDDGRVNVLLYGYDAHHGNDATALPKGLV